MRLGFILACAAMLFAQCNPVSKLGKKEYLLTKNIISQEKAGEGQLERLQIKKGYETVSELNSYLKQKPNTKMLGILKFHLAAYNFATRKERKIKLQGDVGEVTEDIEDRIEKIVGEPPVLVDSMLTAKSSRQMELHLYNKGYFKGKVQDSIEYKTYLKHAGGKARVHYNVTLGPRYSVGKVNYDISDNGIRSLLDKDKKISLIQIGSSYDETLMDDERGRIVKRLKNEGYFFFSKEYIRFIADTALGGHSIDLTMKIDLFKIKTEEGIKEIPHKRYKIAEIFIQPDFYPNAQPILALDTVPFGDYNFLILPGTLNEKHDRNAYIRFKTITRKVFIREKGDFKIDHYNNTYKHLAALRIFKFINIQFTKTEDGDSLNCLIQLNPIPKHSIQIEAEGTHAEGNLGIVENLIYTNKNIFKGAETLEASLKGGVESQQVYADADKSIDEYGLFNTAEIRPELKINFPRLLFPVKQEMIPKRYNPKTSAHVAYNYQLRSDYTRWIWEGGFTYEWRESAQKTHVLSPINVSLVKIEDDSPILDSAFTNDFIRNSFTNLFISATRYSFIYTSQQLNRKTNFTYFRGNVEAAGNSLRSASSMIKAEPDSTDGYYSVFGIRYSQYLRADIDVRNYNFINAHSTIVFRFAAGLGLPYGNSTVMPFEKSFFSGGANGMRAWQARNLGPGAYNGVVNFDQIADIKIEANVESRFEFIGPIEGAAFIDAGNIWLTQEDPERPGAMFDLGKFYNEIAIGAGLGIRLNYDYFIIRVDAAVPIKDPSKDVGSRWVVGDAPFSNINYNLGIGYPF